jgi:hypothetical protein
MNESPRQVFHADEATGGDTRHADGDVRERLLGECQSQHDDLLQGSGGERAIVRLGWNAPTTRTGDWVDNSFALAISQTNAYDASQHGY